MAVTHQATGARSAGGAGTVNPAYPAGVAAGRLGIASRVVKPETAVGNALAGWTQRVSAIGGTGVTGIDAGPTRVVVDTRLLDGSETGSIALTNSSSPNSSLAVISIYSIASGSWDIAVTSGDDATHGTGRIAVGSAIALAPGDVVLAIVAVDTDAVTASSSHSITAPGITFGASTERLAPGGVATGNDSGLWLYEATVTSGTATAAPTLTVAGGPSNCGPVAFVRLREISSISGGHITETTTLHSGTTVVDSAPVYSDEVLADSPLVYWRLGEASGTTATDASGNAKHGTIAGTPTLGVTGLIVGEDTAFTLDGVDDKVSVADTTDLTAVTIECWVKVPSTPAAARYILGRNGIFDLQLLNGSGRVWFDVENNSAQVGGAYDTDGPNVCDNAPHHLVATWRASDGAAVMYIDAVVVATGTRTGTGLNTANAAFEVGKLGANTAWAGTIDEVAYYTTALSAARVTAHYDAGATPGSTVVSGSHITQTTTLHSGSSGLLITNLEPSPSFETVENWAAVSGSDNPTTSTEQAYVGTKSLKAVRGAGTGTPIARRTSFTTESLSGAGTYTLTIQMWVPAFVVDARVRLSGTGVTAYSGSLVAGPNPRDQWVGVTLRFVWDGTGTAILDLIDQNVTSGAYFYADALMIIKGTPLDWPYPYFDGDSVDTAVREFRWLGTAHDSRSTMMVALLPADPPTVGTHVTETTTVYSGTVIEPMTVVGGHITETTTVNDGTTSSFSSDVMLGGHITEITTVYSGESSNTVIAVVGDDENRVGGRWRNGIGYASWTPDLQLPPVTEPSPRISALAFTAPTVDPVNGRVAYTASRVEQVDYIDRLIVGSKDVTFWRGVHTPTPSFILVEPFGYGPASMTFPQVPASFEEPGAGELWFLRLGASVEIQRVNRLTDEIIATDYKGIVISHDTSGATLTCQVGGEATGRAAMRQQQVPIFTWKKDVGRMAHDAIRSLGLRFDPFLGPVTGIRVQRFGGTGMLDYMQQIIAMSWNRDGNRWTVMPNEETSAYEMFRKDRTTIHATAYLDDSRTAGSLLRDMSEEPNRYFMTGVTPEGMRVRFGAYPGLKYTEPPPYPFTGEGTFGQGTTDEDTDTGDGITILINRLFIMKYLDRESIPGGYDIDVTRAVKDLQRDAGLNVTGNVNMNTWRVLYDFDTTGWSLRGSKILPAAEAEVVKKWNRSPSGALLSRNPEYDPSVPPVDRNIDIGTGYERTQMREWARSELEDSSSDNWVGSITFTTGALIAGEHNPGDALIETDIMPVRDLRPGMNIWLPTFVGGILVHVASVSVGGDVSVDVDTRARDAMEVWEVMARNRESRRSLRRAFIREHRSSTGTKDSTTPWDEVGGIVGDKITIPANTWVVFPVIAGQEGTIARLRVRTNPNAEYVMAVFGKRIWPGRLKRSIGNPLTQEGTKKWAKESIRDSLDSRFIMLYVAGSNEEPLGYFPKTKSGEGDEGGSTPLTGRWEDDAGFPYRCFNAPVLWVAVYADRETSIPQGRMMWPQLESGT